MAVKVGIDLGTTNTLVVTEQKGKLKNIKFAGSNNLPSAIFFDDNGEIIVGEKAKERGIIFPKRTIQSAKTYMGDFSKYWEIDGKKITPTMVATEVLKEVKDKVLKKLKLDESEEVEAVITVPAYFTSNQKDETKKAAINAGIKVLKIITEPVSAALAYGMEDLNSRQKLFVFDLGGGTFDVAVLEADPDNNEYNTVALDGDKKLGGDDFDIVLQEVFIQKIKDDTGLDLSSFEKSKIEEDKYLIIKSKLLALAEKTKINLSETEEVEARENYLFTINNDKEYHFEMNVTRDIFHNAAKKLIDRIKMIIERCLDDKGISKNEIDRVIMVGGSSNLTFVPELLEEIFGKAPYSNLDVGNLVVQGAAQVANSYDGMGNSKLNLTEHISHSLGVEVYKGGRMVYDPILHRGSDYKISNSETYSTVMDNQESVMINVYEGENRDNLDENEFYGGFELTGIERAKAGVPQIKVTFSFDNDGILVVTAEDENTGAKREVKMTKGEKKIEKAQETDIALVMDLSGSMSGSRIVEALKAGDALVNEILDLSSQKLAVIGFANRADIMSTLSNDKKVLVSSVLELKRCMDRGNLGGGTNMYEGIRLGMDTLRYSNNKKVIILVTDGEDGNNSRGIARDARNQGIELYAVGVAGANRSYLGELTGSSEKIFMLNNMNQLQETFKTIVNRLSYR